MSKIGIAAAVTTGVVAGAVVLADKKKRNKLATNIKNLAQGITNPVVLDIIKKFEELKQNIDDKNEQEWQPILNNITDQIEAIKKSGEKNVTASVDQLKTSFADFQSQVNESSQELKNHKTPNSKMTADYVKVKAV